MTRVSFALVGLLIAAAPLRAAAQGSGLSQTSPFQGSVPRGTATATALTISLRDALDRALATNLGVIESAEGVRSSHAQWLRSLSSLLPNVTAKVSTTTDAGQSGVTRISRTSRALRFRRCIGPFSYVDARVTVSQRVFNWADINDARSASATRQASELSYKAARELVVQATANAYLVTIADAALVDATRAQVETAQAALQQTVDQNQAGVVASIDVLRARVELQTEQQRLIARREPAGDRQAGSGAGDRPSERAGVHVGDAVPYSELAELTLDQALRRAPMRRGRTIRARKRRSAPRSSRGGRQRPGTIPRCRSTRTTAPSERRSATRMERSASSAAVTIPIFQGTSVRADVLQADAALTRHAPSSTTSAARSTTRFGPRF